MADLLSILSNAATSLAAQTAVEATVSHNVANVDTPGYARQRAVIETLPAEQVKGAFIGRGAQLETVTQVRDRFVEAQLPVATGNAARSSAESTALSSVDALDSDAQGGLTTALSSFYSAMRALSQNASDSGLRQSAVSAAQALALAFNQTSNSLESARSGLDQQIEGYLPQVNTLAQQVADLNDQIRAARASGAEPNDLLDARQNALDQLYELTGATPVNTSDGDVNVTLSGGVGLVTGDLAATLSAVPDVANLGHVAVAISVSGQPATTLSSSALGGSLGGALSARDGAIATAENQIDTLAFDLAGAVNTVHEAGYGLDGVNGRDLFDVGATAAGAAGRMAVSADVAAKPGALAAAASASGLPGDSQNLLSLIGTEDQALSTGTNAASTLANITAAFGARAQQAQSLSDQDSAIKDHFTSLRDSASGVSIDEELITMQAAQRAYQAVTEVIQTTDNMLATLLSIKTT